MGPPPTRATAATSPLAPSSAATCRPRRSTSRCSTCRTRTRRTSSSGSRTTSSARSATFPPRASRCRSALRQLHLHAGGDEARRRAVHLDVPPQGLPPLVHRRGHGRDGVHRGRVQHERPRLRVPAVPGRLRRGGGRVRGGGRRGVLSAPPLPPPVKASDCR